jgi:hypothetical protein
MFEERYLWYVELGDIPEIDPAKTRGGYVK